MTTDAVEEVKPTQSSIESLLDEFEAAVKAAAYSDCSPMGDPGKYYKHMERDEARKALLAHMAALAADRAEWQERAARLAEAERDAARYRWLRDVAGNEIMRHLMDECRPAVWDVLVDQARAADSAEPREKGTQP